MSLSTIKLPTREECLEYFERYVVPGNIKRHCIQVANVAQFLAEKLKESGVEINVELVERAALFHDMFKVVVLNELKPNKHHNYKFSEEEIAMWKKLRKQYQGMYESDVAYEILKDVYPELALTVKNSSDPKSENKTWEELVVHYADWRVFRESIVLLNERLEYLREQYPRDDGAWDRYEKVIGDIENTIFAKLPLLAERLVFEVEDEIDVIKGERQEMEKINEQQAGEHQLDKEQAEQRVKQAGRGITKNGE